MSLPKWEYTFPFSFFINCYWCFIPIKCRNCKWLTQCRKPSIEGRKCYNGCIELNILRERKKDNEREDYIQSLVDYYDNQK